MMHAADHGAQGHPHGTAMDAPAIDHAAMGHAGHDMHAADTSPPQSPAAMDHAAMDHSDMQHAGMGEAAMDHAAHAHAGAHGNVSTAAEAPSSAQASPASPLPPPTAADIAAAFPPLQPHAMHAPAINHYVLLDRLEHHDDRDGSGQAWEARAWIGGDIDRLWLRSEGEHQAGSDTAGFVEAFYGHAISPWWDLLIGGRQDVGDAARGRAALGIQGLAPYKFETEATLYLGRGGATALRLEGEYDLLLTNRLILQPRVEADIAVTNDRRRGIDSGLEQVEFGLRLRYEINRRFAPYVGWVHQRAYGDSARRAAAQGDGQRDQQWLVGLRLWF
ncbi:copper resistance protein B [Xanthomonas maliensis]|uniref:copper resistance protein B n=1 Tax=Xanthomonas maliensis TaxID=1321368 RepID=UPI003CCD6CCC